MLLRELAAPLGPLSEGRWKPSRGRITIKLVRGRQSKERGGSKRSFHKCAV